MSQSSHGSAQPFTWNTQDRPHPAATPGPHGRLSVGVSLSLGPSSRVPQPTLDARSPRRVDILIQHSSVCVGSERRGEHLGSQGGAGRPGDRSQCGAEPRGCTFTPAGVLPLKTHRNTFGVHCCCNPTKACSEAWGARTQVPSSPAQRAECSLPGRRACLSDLCTPSQI